MNPVKTIHVESSSQTATRM